jgi:dipeptidyl aminopeptidase/acylaminoacyl peptidase
MRLKIRFLLALAPCLALAQVTPADYQRASTLREKFQDLAVNIPGPANWIDQTDRFWYRKSVKGGHEFVLADAVSQTKKPAFDHARLATSLSTAIGSAVAPLALPFTEIRFLDGERAIRFSASGSDWKCTLSDYACIKLGPAQSRAAGASNRAPWWDDGDASPSEFTNDVLDGISDFPPQGQAGPPITAPARQDPQVNTSPNGKWEASIENFNVYLRPNGSSQGSALSDDGSEGNYYTIRSIAWSPDSTHLVAYRVRPGYRREVHYVESSPADQLQPKHFTREYAKPGDTLDIAQPVLFDVEARKEIEIDRSLFPNPYSLSRPVWWKDSRGFTFEYNQRGHQVYRVIEIDAKTAAARALISEESPTFIDYRPLVPNPRDTGKKVRHDVNDGKEIIWASERDGWEHLYLYDGVSGKVKNQITKGNWVVRAIDKIDDEKRQIWFQASGMDPGRNPYYVQEFRIDFDGSGLTRLTEADGDHTVKFSTDMRYYVDTWSRVDAPSVAELRRTEDKKPIMELERGEIDPLLEAGWKVPESFTAVGRDGKTDIWGVIYKPTNFDPSKKYPVVESIYSGPQGSFVPTAFSASVQPLAELGFIVVQIDGMGTNNRSKAFHDVAWKNLGDAGFADRILWHKAVAAKYPWYDITRAGVFGNSAGGQNAMGALLFHSEFYKAAVANSGCHDNRMDKIWWNELWMGWPVGRQYAAASNVENASKLEGKLLLIVGELDTNVDPSSTLQVVNALIKANKKFDLLFVPGRRSRRRRSLRPEVARGFLCAQSVRRGTSGLESHRRAAGHGREPLKYSHSSSSRQA